jgi:hypothetical protein
MLNRVDLLPEDEYDRFMGATALITSAILLVGAILCHIVGRPDAMSLLAGTAIGVMLMDFLFGVFRPNNPRTGYYKKSARERKDAWRKRERRGEDA